VASEVDAALMDLVVGFEGAGRDFESGGGHHVRVCAGAAADLTALDAVADCLTVLGEAMKR
jgi:hypothetical protein